jgi:hypothetical protein
MAVRCGLPVPIWARENDWTGNMEFHDTRLPVRRFNLGDCLILLGALAITLRYMRQAWLVRFPKRLLTWWAQLSMLVGATPWPSPMLRGDRVIRDLLGTMVIEFQLLLLFVLAGLAVAQPTIRLRPPRPALKNLVRQPGFVCCLEVIVATVVLVDLKWFGLGAATLWVTAVALVLRSHLFFCSGPSSAYHPGARRRPGSIGWVAPSDGAGSSKWRVRQRSDTFSETSERTRQGD